MNYSRYDYLKLDRTTMGVPLAQAVCEEVDRRNAKRVLMVISGTLNRDTGIAGEVSQRLGGRFAGCYDGTVTHVPRQSVIALANAVRESGADLVLTVGGGTCLDSVKMALLCLAEDISHLGMPTRLRDAGVTHDHFQAIAQGSLLNAWVRANPEPIDTVEQVVEILEAAY